MSLTTVKIDDLGEVITGNTPPKKDPKNYGGTYPFIKPTDMIIDKRHVTEWEENYSEKAFKKYRRAYIPPGATGVVTIGTVGEKLFQAHQYCFTNQSVNVIIPNENYHQDYIYYLMKLNLPKVENANPGTASGRHHVSKSNFCSIKVNVIKSIDSQKRIADILSTYDDLIENNLKHIKLLEQAAQNIYKEWFVNMRFPGHENTPINKDTALPDGWKEVEMDDIMDISGGGTPSTKEPLYWDNGNVPWFSPTDLNKNNSLVLINSSKKITELGLKKSSAKLLPNRTILMSSRATIGLFGLFNGECSTNQGFININPKQENLRYYILFNLKSRVEELISNSSGATFKELSKRVFKRMSIVNPRVNIIDEFYNYTEEFINQIENLELQNQKLKAARDVLLPRLMNRTIEV